MLCKPSVFRPHSSSDPLTLPTFPPGEGFGCNRWRIYLFYLRGHRRLFSGPTVVFPRPILRKMENHAIIILL